MPKHVIVASDCHQMQCYYFLGYEDAGAVCETRWTLDPWRARWIDAAEAAVEVELLANLCPNYRLRSWSLEIIGNSNVD
jgi:hypothetical protein